MTDTKTKNKFIDLLRKDPYLDPREYVHQFAVPLEILENWKHEYGIPIIKTLENRNIYSKLTEQEPQFTENIDENLNIVYNRLLAKVVDKLEDNIASHEIKVLAEAVNNINNTVKNSSTEKNASFNNLADYLKNKLTQ